MKPRSDLSPEALVARVEALREVVERQRRYIDSMRASRFWKMRDWAIALRTRLFHVRDPLPVETSIERALTQAALGDVYQLFVLRHKRTDEDLQFLRSLIAFLTTRTPIEIVVDTRRGTIDLLKSTLTSIVDQVYPYWTARLLCDETNEERFRLVSEAAIVDTRIRIVRDTIVHPADSAACFIDAGDLLEPDALFFVAVQLFHGADVVYTDEDQLQPDSTTSAPSFKPDWSPETTLAYNYVGQLCVFRVASLERAGGIDYGIGTAGQYDALLRIADFSDSIAHVPRVLFHRSFTEKEAPEAGREWVQRALARRGENASVETQSGGNVVRFAVPDDERVSIIIPTRDRADLLSVCLSQLFERTDHRAFDVIVVDNGSVEPETHALIKRFALMEPRRFSVLEDPAEFNYSRLNNRAVAITDAPYIVLLNNDTEVISAEWLTAMQAQARRPAIGAVGALLLYADNTIQHAGIILGGVLDLAGHAYRNFRPDEKIVPRALRFDTNYLAVTGACLMVGREKYLGVGGLDESLAVSYNDVDLCLKLRHAGLRNVFVPRARLYHHESKSRGLDVTPEQRDRAYIESEKIRQRWKAWSRSDPYYNRNLTVTAEDFSVRL